MSPYDMKPVRCPSFSSQNPNRRPGEDSPPGIVPSDPLGFLLPQAPDPNAAPPVLYSFFPLSPNDMESTTPTSPTPDTANPTSSCPPNFAPSQTVNPGSFQLFLPPSHAVNESLLPNDPTIHSRPLQSQEASSASRPVDGPPFLRRQHITTDSEIRRQGLEALAKKLIKEAKRAEAARISHPGLQIDIPPAKIAQQTPKSDARNITKSVPSMVGKAVSSKTTASDLFSVAKALGGDTLLDLVWAAYASYVSKDETEGRR